MLELQQQLVTASWHLRNERYVAALCHLKIALGLAKRHGFAYSAGRILSSINHTHKAIARNNGNA
jgi:hypothetical protein